MNTTDNTPDQPEIHLPTPYLDAALERARSGINLSGIYLLDAEIAAMQMEDSARRRY